MARRNDGTGKLARPKERASSCAASRPDASTTVTISSNMNSRNTFPSGLKKNRSASRTVCSSSFFGWFTIPLLELTRNRPSPTSESRSEVSTFWDPTKSPAVPISFDPRTPSTLNALPSPSSRILLNFSSACSKSITFSASKALSRP